LAKTLAQKAADKALDEAMDRVVDAYKLLPRETLVDYVVVIEGITLDDEGETDGEGFGLAFRHGHCRSTAAIGLLHKGLELFQFGNVVIDEEE